MGVAHVCNTKAFLSHFMSPILCGWLMTKGGLSYTYSCFSMYDDQVSDRLQLTRYHKSSKWNCGYCGSTMHCQQRSHTNKGNVKKVLSTSWCLADMQLWNKEFKFTAGPALLRAPAAMSHLAKMRVSAVGKCQAHIMHKILCHSEWSQTVQERTGAEHYSRAGLVEST